MSQVQVVNNMEPRTKAPFYTVFMNMLNTSTNLLLGAVGVSVVFIPNLVSANGNRPWQSYVDHIHLCTFGYSLLMLQTILSFNPSTGWAENMMYPQKRLVHLLMQICGCVLAIIGGSLALFAYKVYACVGPHCIMGVIVYLLTFVSLVGAVVQLLCSQRMDNKLMKTLQTCAIVVTVIMAFVAISLGFEALRNRGAGDTNTDLSIAVTSLAIVGMVAMAIAHVLKRGFNFVI